MFLKLSCRLGMQSCPSQSLSVSTWTIDWPEVTTMGKEVRSVGSGFPSDEAGVSSGLEIESSTGNPFSLSLIPF